MDLAAAIRWKQFRAPTLSDNQDVIQEVISIAIKQFDEVKAQEIIDRWTEEGRQTDWSVERLLERVGLRIFERFEIEMQDETAGLRLPVGRIKDAEEET